MNKQSIAVGVCTYKRPEMLEECLASINSLKRPKAAQLCVIITDNDPRGSAVKAVEDFRRKTELPVHYEIEEGRGIPFARNNVLTQAEKINIDALAFIDDDETADPLWLCRLFDYYVSSGCDVARGYVKTVYPPETPEWIVRGGFYQRKNRETGTMLTSSITGNVLFNFRTLCLEHGLRFDESIGLQGGSDSDFFRRAHEQGAAITWVADAVVYETLEAERFKLSYLLKRKFRTRNGKTFFRNLSFTLRARTFFSSLKRIFLGLLLLPVGLVRGSHHSAAALGEIAAGLGRLLGVCGIHPGWNEYDQKE